MTEHRKAYCKEYSRKYYLANKERLITNANNWRAENPIKRKAIMSKYRADHKQQIENYGILHKEDQRKRNLKFHCGLTLEEYNRLFVSQNGLCLGCYRHQSQFKLALAVDHCHTTGKIRGLLCGSCNTALGLLKDSPTSLRRLADYLEK